MIQKLPNFKVVVLTGAFAVLGGLLVSCAFQTAGQPLQQPAQSLSLTLTPKASRADPTAGWKTRIITLYGLELALPPQWTIQEINRRPNELKSERHDCAEYTIANGEGNVSLFLLPICGFDEGSSKPWPGDAVVIKKLENEEFVIRFFDLEHNVYVYAKGGPVIVSGENGEERRENWYREVLSFARGQDLLAMMRVNLSYLGPDLKKDEYLQIADKVVDSIRPL